MEEHGLDDFVVVNWTNWDDVKCKVNETLTSWIPEALFVLSDLRFMFHLLIATTLHQEPEKFLS